MIGPLAILLTFQLAGEALARGLGLPVPGPVIGLLVLVLAVGIHRPLEARLRPVTQALLAHLSLLFVPAGVGIVGHLDLVRSEGMALIAALVLSTALAIVAGSLTFAALARRLAPEEG